jgi:hypothetical protein
MFSKYLQYGSAIQFKCRDSLKKFQDIMAAWKKDRWNSLLTERLPHLNIEEKNENV